jgi:hypothetical protein
MYYDCGNIELVNDEFCVAKLKATFILDKDAQLLLSKWLKSLQFPDGYASNIVKLMNLGECKLYGMKSQDYHMFIQTLIPTAYMTYCQKEYEMYSRRLNIF